MAKQVYHLYFPEDLVQGPVAFLAARNNNLTMDIRRADVKQGVGDMIVELEGEMSDIEAAVKELEAQSVQVKLASGDVVSG